MRYLTIFALAALTAWGLFDGLTCQHRALTQSIATMRAYRLQDSVIATAVFQKPAKSENKRSVAKAHLVEQSALLGKPLTQPELHAALWIVEHESGYNPNSRNRHSTAHGLGQLLDSSWRNVASRSGRRLSRDDPGDQAAAMCLYVWRRYGTFVRAQATWRKRRSY